MKNDFDFIKDKFDNDGVSAPIELDESQVAAMLEGKAPKRIKLHKKKTFKAAISLVASLAIVVSCITLSNYNNSGYKKNESLMPVESNITYFDNYNQLERKMKNIHRQYKLLVQYGSVFKGEAATDEIMDEAAITANESETGISIAEKNSSYATTYTQVDGIDEGDIVKNDGKYIYVASYNDYDTSVDIYEGNGAKPKRVAHISDIKRKNENICEAVSDMYVTDGRLIVNTQLEEFPVDDDGIQTGYEYLACTYIYDISDINNIKRISSFTQSGQYNSSRMIGNKLYIVSSKSYESSNDHIPYTMYDNSKKEYISADSICYPESPKSTSILVISAIDTQTGKKAAKSKAMLGFCGTVYCNKDNMYIAVNSYNGNSPNISIIKASLGDEIAFENSVRLDGMINNQFSMDEYNGYFRIATTTEKYNDDSIDRSNNLFVLDSKLKLVGKVCGFAKDESVKAVKFMGDTAYVITYEQTDPLFVIDLKNPQKPAILGSVEIDGFSSQLLTIGEDRILGIGYNVVDSMQNGIKLVLFDVSNKAKPRVLDSYVLENASSAAQFNHKAIVINKGLDYYAIDYERFGFDEFDSEDNARGVITFNVKDDKINVTNLFESNLPRGNEWIYGTARTTYIDNYIYLISIDGICAFEYKE